MRADEGCCDLAYAEAADEREDQHHLRSLRQSALAAREHHPQPVVANVGRLEDLRNGMGERPLRFEQAPIFGCERSRGSLATQYVDRAVARGAHQPCRWVLRHAALLPDFQSAAEGVLNDVFCQLQIVQPEDARERGDHASRLTAEKMVALLHATYLSS